MKRYFLCGALLLIGLASTMAQEDSGKDESSPALGMPSEKEKKEAIKKIEKAEKKAEKEERERKKAEREKKKKDQLNKAIKAKEKSIKKDEQKIEKLREKLRKDEANGKLSPVDKAKMVTRIEKLKAGVVKDQERLNRHLHRQ